MKKESGNVSNKITSKEELVRFLEDYGKKGFAPNALDFLYDESEVIKVRIISFPLKGESRVDAIIRQTKDYSQLRPEQYAHFIYCIEYSMRHPLLMDEEQRLRDFCQKMSPNAESITIGTSTDDSLGDKILLTIICSR